MGTDIHGHAEYRYNGAWIKLSDVPDVRCYDVFSLFTDYRDRDYIKDTFYDIDDDGRAIMKGIPGDAKVSSEDRDYWNVGQTWFTFDELWMSRKWFQVQNLLALDLWITWLTYINIYCKCSYIKTSDVRIILGFDN